MKHFFFPHAENSKSEDILDLLQKNLPQNDTTNEIDENALKAYYDLTDCIYDKRFDQSDEQLEKLLKTFQKNISGRITASKASSGSTKPFRLRLLNMLWDDIDKRYNSFTVYCDRQMHISANDSEHAPQRNKVSIMLALFHLVRGNLCLRISLCYYEIFNLAESDSWASRGIEILWHGKNLLASVRDSVEQGELRTEADLYLRLTKLNLAKYYRDYARKNRRSDFDAALDEYKHIRRRVEEEYDNTSDSSQKRQYALIWMDAIINIIKIKRRKYLVHISEQNILSLYCYLKKRMGKEDLKFCSQKDPDSVTSTIQTLLEKADTAISYTDVPQNTLSEQNQDLEELTDASFEKFNALNTYDKMRYFLLVLLELARVRRDMHFENNYKSAIAISIIAVEWSHMLDKRIGYEPGHNIDAMITISSSLRKCIKFQKYLNIEDLLPEQKITWKIQDIEYSLQKSSGQGNGTITFPEFIEKLTDFANKGSLKSKAEVIKWHCLYQQEPELLDIIRKELPDNLYEDAESNCQLYFLKGLACLRTEKYKEAIEIFTTLLKKNENEMRYIRLGTLGLKVRYLLANCYMSQVEFSKAEKILKELHDTLADAKKSRESQENNAKSGQQKTQGENIRQMKENTDAEPDARVEVDLGYCYMQRGAYEEAYEIYYNLFGDGGPSGQEPDFGLKNVAQQRRIMGLNNYASCCIFSINFAMNDNNTEKSLKKMETARKIFRYLYNFSSKTTDEKISMVHEADPETNLLVGYYTLCTGIEPETLPITPEQFLKCNNTSETAGEAFRAPALLKAFPFFRKACRFEAAFLSRYDLLDKYDKGNKGRYRNEVERISAYIISLTKLHKFYLSRQKDVDNLTIGSENADRRLFGGEHEVTDQQLRYLKESKRALERFLLSFPANYRISLKAAIALAEWLLDSDKRLESENTAASSSERGLQSQLYRSFSYVTIYEERGAGVFNALKVNSKFRFFNAAQRGKLCALLLAMYKPIKALKEECCFNTEDKERNPHLVHYTSMETLKKILTEVPGEKPSAATGEKSPDASGPRFRLNNCGYMNDVFEGKTFLKSIDFVLGQINSISEPMQSSLIEKYFPQISRSDKDLSPSASNVYIGSLSVKTDSFPMWSVYSAKESGCNIEFGHGFFNINGVPCLPEALRDYTLSKYTDQDYPLYIVQYIGSKFESSYKGDPEQEPDYETIHASGHLQSCGTMAICYTDHFRILRQIAWRWKNLENYLETVSGNAVSGSIDVIRAFAADRINEIRFLFKDGDYKYEGEVRVIYTDSAERSAAKINTIPEVPRVYVDIERELEGLTIRLGSRIEDATVDKYVTWLKHTNRVKTVLLAEQNRYTT